MKIQVYGKQGCALCQTTKRKLAHFLQKWGCGEKVELVFVDMETVKGLAESAFNDVSEIPTTLVSAGGDVIGRWEGSQLPSSDEVKALIDATA